MADRQHAESQQWVPLVSQSVHAEPGSEYMEISAANPGILATADLLMGAGIEIVWDPYDPREQLSGRGAVLRTFTLMVHPHDHADALEVLRSLGDPGDLAALADQQYLSPWVAPGAVGAAGASESNTLGVLDDGISRTEDGDFVFESDRRAAEEKRAARQVQAEDAEGAGGRVALVLVVMVVVFAIVLIAISDYAPQLLGKVP